MKAEELGSRMVSRSILSEAGSDFLQRLPLSLMCSAPEGPSGKNKNQVSRWITLTAALAACLLSHGINRVEWPVAHLSGPLHYSAQGDFGQGGGHYSFFFPSSCSFSTKSEKWAYASVYILPRSRTHN